MTERPDMNVLEAHSLEVAGALLGRWVDTITTAVAVQKTIPPDALPRVDAATGNVWDILVPTLLAIPPEELAYGQALLSDAAVALGRLSHPHAYGQDGVGTTRDRDEAGMDEVGEARTAALEEEVERLRTELSRTRGLLVAHLEGCPGASQALSA